MRETLHDQVEVLAGFKHGPKPNIVRVIPYCMDWRGRRYQLTTMGLHHPERRGHKVVHIFGFSSGNTAFRLELDPETLEWTLVEAYYGS